jgi:uncharacterized protein YbcI
MFITIYLRNFITPSERVLLEQDHEMIVDQMREKLIQMMVPEISSYVEIVTGIKPREFYYDWALHNKSGMLVGVCQEPIPNGMTVNEQYEGREGLEKEVVRISYQAQKTPEEIYS